MASLVRNFVSGLSPREAKLLIAMGFVIVLMGVFLSLFFLKRAVSDLEHRASEYAELGDLVKAMAPTYRANQSAEAASVGQEKPLPLRTLVEKSVQKVGLGAPDTKERNSKTHTSGWKEQGSDVTFRQINLEPLVRFLEEIESYKRRFPIAVTDMKIRKHRRKQNEFMVTMTITTYEKLSEQEMMAGKTKKGGVK